MFCRFASNLIPTNIQNVGILKDIDQKSWTLTEKDFLSGSFNVKLLNSLFSSCLWKNFGTRCFLLLSFFFFISNITKIKYLSLQSLKRYWRNLKVHVLVSVNIIDIFKVTAKYRRKIISKYRQKIVIYCLVGTRNHVHNSLRVFDSWPNFPFL